MKRLDGSAVLLLNLAIVGWIEPLENESRIASMGGRDVFIDVQQSPEQILAAPQVGW